MNFSHLQEHRRGVLQDPGWQLGHYTAGPDSAWPEQHASLIPHYLPLAGLGGGVGETTHTHTVKT